LNPALNRRIKAPKKIEDPRKQAVLKVQKKLMIGEERSKSNNAAGES
jgi:hypothetical protein